MIELYNLKDTYQTLHPQVHRYTWRHLKTPDKKKPDSILNEYNGICTH